MSCNETVLENYVFLVNVYYTDPGYQTSICGKNRAYYIRIFTVSGFKLEIDIVQNIIKDYTNLTNTGKTIILVLDTQSCQYSWQ